MNLRKQCLFLRHNSGSMLVITIWILVSFSILSAALYNITYMQVNVTKALRARIGSYYLAKAACVYVQAQRQAGQAGYDTLYELRREREQELGRGKFRYIIIDEESKININKISLGILERLPGINKELAKDISKSSLKPFKAKEELLCVNGMTLEIFEALSNFITVYGQGRVNINTAEKEVFSALGLENDVINLIERYRAGLDAKPETEDDDIFKSTGNILGNLRSFGQVSPKQEALITQLINNEQLGVAAENFALEIDTEVLGVPAVKYNIIVDKDKILRWVEQ